ncbi:MAG: lytic murein transglycosylase B [Chromatiales bacterium]|nr:lytic murein transglycosylase B [Chromatiales bacterium]
MKLSKVLSPLLTTLALLLPIAETNAAKPADFDRKLQQFAQEMSNKHGFALTELNKLLADVTYKQSIIDAISRPAEGKAWHEYRPIFVTDKRARAGVKFWQENQELLKQAEKKYGVPPEIITAIIGVETLYGSYTGKYQVLDALSTLAFAYPKRSKFFRKQLEEFLLLIKEEKLPPKKMLGSYAGAMGMPQFIPSSYRAYAVDFDKDGKRDLLGNKADVIGSVAAYFSRHGWQQGEPITQKAWGITADHNDFVKAGMKPSLTIQQLQQAGIKMSQPPAPDSLTSLIRLRGKQGNEYWLGLNNFYVITRYNHSNLYAMAVYQLSREILKQKEHS